MVVQVVGPRIESASMPCVAAGSDQPVNLVVWPIGRQGTHHHRDYTIISSGPDQLSRRGDDRAGIALIASRALSRDSDWHGSTIALPARRFDAVHLERDVWIGDSASSARASASAETASSVPVRGREGHPGEHHRGGIPPSPSKDLTKRKLHHARAAVADPDALFAVYRTEWRGIS